MNSKLPKANVIMATAVGVALLMMGYGANADAAESVSFGLAHIDDGGCEDPTIILEGEYRRTGTPLEVEATVRTAPSGGDCRQRATSYGIEAKRDFPLGDSAWEASVKFAADERAFLAPYAQVVGGMVDLRPDGNANFPVNLPAGVAKTITGGFGVSRAGWYVGANIVPVDWSEYGPGQTLHLGYDGTFGRWSVSFDSDFGRDVFGEARVMYTRGNAEVALTHAWGLNSVYDGAPAEQMVRGATFWAAGAPQDTQTTLSVRFRVDL